MIAFMNLAGIAAADQIAGYDRLTVKAGHRAEPVLASVWYPAGIPTYRGMIGDNAVFKGMPAYVGAAIANGRFPLILLSHGSGGNMDTLSWLSSELARRGAMVLAVNHPGSTTGDSSPRRSTLLHERTLDLSSALETLLADNAFAQHVDEEQIVTLGFSLGGATALHLVGARMNRDAYRAYCDQNASKAQDCLYFAKGGVDLRALPNTWEIDMSDPRIDAAIAVDPGLTYGFTGQSIAKLNLPVLLINLGNEHRWSAADVSAQGSNLTERLPQLDYKVVAPAHHYTFLGLCKPEGATILENEHDDPVCDDPGNSDRAKIHAEIIEHIAVFLGL